MAHISVPLTMVSYFITLKQVKSNNKILFLSTLQGLTENSTKQPQK